MSRLMKYSKVHSTRKSIISFYLILFTIFWICVDYFFIRSHTFDFQLTFDPTTIQSQGFNDTKGGDYRVISGSLLGDYGEISTLSY